MVNLDPSTAHSFDSIWRLHGVSEPSDDDASNYVLETFFSNFPLDRLSRAEGFDLGSGNGRIARAIAPRVGLLNCVEPSGAGIEAASAAFRHVDNVRFYQAMVEEMPLADGSQEFGYSLGVLHHIPDPEGGLRACVAKLKPGAPFLLYVYHNVGHQPRLMQIAWLLSDVARKGISRLPFRLKVAVSTFLAATVYWPLSRLAGVLERLGGSVQHIPLSFYRDHDWATLRADSLDRFGTPLEHRFSKDEVEKMMLAAGLKDISFAAGSPYWIATGYKRG